MTNTILREHSQEGFKRSGGRLPQAGVLLGGLLLAVSPFAAFAQDSAAVPEKMAYVPFGPSIMGIDKDPANTTSSGESASLY
ncbi:MAG: hypothetical protein OEW33_12765, partial [Nitrospirota bacterium]|nr:hypothetical protein [Nitrospirota bacterium]